MKKKDKKLSEWSRLRKVNQYCDICSNNSKDCTEWCYGENFKVSEYKVAKNSLLTKILNLLGINKKKEGE